MNTSASITTVDGAELQVRPIEGGDRSALAALFDRLSPETLYRRFLAPKQRLTAAELSALTLLDHHDREALIAVDGEGRLVGVARFLALDGRPHVAEVAVTVADEWQHRGVGTALLAGLM